MGSVYEARRAHVEKQAAKIEKALANGWLVFTDIMEPVIGVERNGDDILVKFSETSRQYLWIQGESKYDTIERHDSYFKDWIMIDPAHFQSVVKPRRNVHNSFTSAP